MKAASLIIIFTWLIVPGILKAQLDNSFFNDERVIQTRDSSTIQFGLEAFGYLRNNEYRTDLVPGYTLFGYQFRPYFSYFPSNRIRLDAGGFFMKDFGSTDFQEIRPIFTIKYAYRDLSFLFGTIEGGLTHQLIEPVYDFERVINHRIEDGLQFKYKGDRLFLDTWIEWVNMIDFGDNDLEEFNYGLSSIYRIWESQVVRLDIPLQLLVNHRGGEIDVTAEPARTVWNGATGLGLLFPVRETASFRSIKMDGYYVFFQTAESSSPIPYHSGNGWFLNVTGKMKWLDLMLSYWHGNQFYAPNGGTLYQSVSFDFPNDGYTEMKRDLIYLRALFEHDFDHGLTLSIRFEPVYDLNNHQFNHSEGLYLRYRTDWILNRNKKP